MSADELEDYLELQDPKVRRHIAKSTEEFRAGKGCSIDELIAEFKLRRKVKTIGKHRKARRRSFALRRRPLSERLHLLRKRASSS